MIEEMEAELTELSKINSKTENLAVTEEVDVDEAIPTYLQKERKTQAYQKTIKTYIDKINTSEKRKKENTIKWRPVYEVIE